MKTTKLLKLNIAASTLLVISNAPVAKAIVVVGANGTNGANQGEANLLNVAPNFDYYDNIISLGGGTGVYLGGDSSGTGYVLTANHLINLTPGSSSIAIGGSNYGVSASTRVEQTDLRIFAIDGSAGLPSLKNVQYAQTGPSVGEEVLLTGRGTRRQGDDGDANTSDMVNVNGFSVYQSNGAGAISFGTNTIAAPLFWLTPEGNGGSANFSSSLANSQSTFFTDFSDPGAGNYDSSFEGNFSSGDSGGPSFILRDGEWVLAGINSSVITRGSQPSNTSAFGNITTSVNLSAYLDYLPTLDPNAFSAAVPEPSSSLLVGLGLVRLLTLRRRKLRYS